MIKFSDKKQLITIVTRDVNKINIRGYPRIKPATGKKLIL